MKLNQTLLWSHIALLGLGLGVAAQTAPPTATIVGAASPVQSLPLLDLELLVQQAKAAGQKTLKIPPGRYRLAKPSTELTKVENLEIDGTGVTLVFSETTRHGLYLIESHNVTLRGFTLDFDPLPFTQATITRIAPDGMRVDFRLHDGYPRFSASLSGPQAYVFDAKTGLWKPGIGDLYGKVEQTGPNEGSLSFNRKPAALDTISPGDFLAFTQRGGGALHLNRSADIRVEDVTVLAAPGLGVSGRRMDGKNYFRFTVKRGPKPAGATEERLLSTSADAFNYADARQGPTLEKCDFSFMGDDSVNLHGPSFPVHKVEGNTLWVLTPYGRTAFDTLIKPGDTARIMEPQAFAVREQRALVSWEAETTAPEISDEQFKLYWPQRPNQGKISSYKVTLNQPTNAKPGDIIDFPAANSPGYVIRDSYFHDHRARGLRVMASNGVIENNRFERIKGSAIGIGTEMAYWREAGWPQNVLVRGNTIRDVGQGVDIYQSDSFTPGAISLFVRQDEPGKRNAPSEIRDIRILDNIIDGCSVAGIHINAAREVLIRGNRLSRVNLSGATQAGAKYGLSSSTPIVVENSRSVVQENNSTATTTAALPRTTVPANAD